MKKEDLTIFEYRMEKDKNYTHLIKEERLTGSFEKIWYRTKSCGYLNADIYRPQNYNGDHTLSVVFNFHGGGMVLGQTELDGKYCQKIANESNVAVINVDYALAPEFKYPLPLTSSYELVELVMKDYKKYNLNPDSLFLMGSSAGGYIATALCIINDEQKQFSISGLISNYAVLKQDKEPSEKISGNNNKVMKVSRMEQYNNWYFEDNTDKSHPLASPCNADASIFPESLIISAELDPLKEEDKEFANNLKLASIPVEYKEYANCNHGFTHDHGSVYNDTAADDAWKRITNFIKRLTP